MTITSSANISGNVTKLQNIAVCNYGNIAYYGGLDQPLIYNYNVFDAPAGVTSISGGLFHNFYRIFSEASR